MDAADFEERAVGAVGSPRSLKESFETTGTDVLGGLSELLETCRWNLGGRGVGANS